MIQVLAPRVKSQASLQPVFEYWQSISQDQEHPLRPLAQQVLLKAGQVPELRGPLTRELLQSHKDLVTLLLSCVFPSSLQRFSFGAIATPGTFEFHWWTPRFQRELLDEEFKLRPQVMLDGMEWVELQELFQFLHIVRTFYAMEINFDKSVILEDRDAAHGLTRYFQMRAHFDHMRVLPPDPMPELSPADRLEIQENMHDLTVWRRLVRAEQFRYEGLIVFEALEITEEMTVSAIKETLVAKSALMNPERFANLQTLLSQLLKVPGLAFEVGARHLDRIVFFNTSHGTDLNGWEVDEECLEAWMEWNARFQAGEVVVVRDLSQGPGKACQDHVQRAAERGHQSLLLLPLVLEGKLLGLCSLSAPQAGALNSLMPTRLREILPELAWAVKRALDDIEQRVQAEMKQSFTAIHPAVEWKFRRQALEIVRGTSESQDLVFPNVYPLFGTSDVRNSTQIRNRAIQADLREQLELALEILTAASEARALPYLGSREYAVRRFLESLEQELQSGDESKINDFFKLELEPLAATLCQFGPAVAAAWERYRSRLDPKLGILHHRRRHYEESMARVRDAIVDVLNRAQEQAQAVYPHYFELNKTDGVDHLVYLGASVHSEGQFDPLYLKNLRLWQVETMLEVASVARDLVPGLPMALDTAHLILVQDSPLSIRYGLEEKHFNVDGAYNARYEILKKRIDKAEVRETGERLTQPGKLAIVYSHRRERIEYLDYLEYLRNIGRVQGEIEDLELSPLQDVQGLRALRVQAG